MGRITSFILGAGVGAAAALMFAPKAGDQMRALVTEKANAVLGEAKDFSGSAGSGVQDAYKAAQEKGVAAFQNIAAKGQEIAAAAQSRSGEAFNSAAEAVRVATGQQAAPSYAGENDDLREKIEAARQRIAAQVIQNAQESNLTVPVEEAVAEVVETAEEAAGEVVEAAEQAAEVAEQAVEQAAEAVEEVKPEL